MDRLYEPLNQQIEGAVYTSDQANADFSTNFGHLHYWTPRFVVHPKTAQDVVNVVQFARANNLFVTTRGSAHSQSQLAISDGGILLNMKALNQIGHVDEDNATVEVEGGVVWRDLVHHVKKWSMAPRVLTNNLGVTIGGTLSVAGIGVASFRYGSQGDNVEEMDVVLGNGELHTCGPDNNPDLFWSVIAGLGQIGVITRAKLKLRKTKSMTRSYYLLYDNIRTFMDDAVTAMDGGKFEHIESWASPCPQGTKPINGRRQVFAKWFYPAHLTVEYEPGDEPNDAEMLNGLTPYDNLYTDDIPITDFLERLVPVFELWKKAGTWDHTHPWMETVLPYETAADYIDQVLPDLPPGMLVGGHILLWPAKGTVSNSRLFKRPDGENLIGFGILPAIPHRYWDQVRPLLDNASRLSCALGGKRYLSGWIDFDQDEWKEHYGDKWDWFCECKAKWDPDGIMSPGFIPFNVPELAG